VAGGGDGYFRGDGWGGGAEEAFWGDVVRKRSGDSHGRVDGGYHGGGGGAADAEEHSSEEELGVDIAGLHEEEEGEADDGVANDTDLGMAVNGVSTAVQEVTYCSHANTIR
jgi:hypothetical protein